MGTPTKWFTLVAKSFIFLGPRGLKSQKVLDTLKNWHLSRRKPGCLETDSQTYKMNFWWSGRDMWGRDS